MKKIHAVSLAIYVVLFTIFCAGCGGTSGGGPTVDSMEIDGSLQDEAALEGLDGEAIDIEDAVDVSFQDQVYLDGDLHIRASGTVVFADELVILRAVTQSVTSSKGIRRSNWASA